MVSALARALCAAIDEQRTVGQCKLFAAVETDGILAVGTIYGAHSGVKGRVVIVVAGQSCEKAGHEDQN